jgi:FKBP-type peptidyl-prolyl cis-trans isomerase SlyD
MQESEAHATEYTIPEQRIGPDKVVRLRFWARERDSGELLQFGDDLSYLHGGYGGVFPKVEARLEGLELNGRAETELAPEEGYGEYDPHRVIVQPRHTLPEEAVEIGCVLHGEAADGTEQPYVVTAVDEAAVTLDANHPWAGKSLLFQFEVLELRDSTEAERRVGFPLF